MYFREHVVSVNMLCLYFRYIFEGYLDGTYSCYCPLNSSLDGTTECNDGSQCEDGNLGHITCGLKGLACKEKNKVKIS